MRTTQISKCFEMDQLESVQNFSCVESNRVSRGSLGPPAISFIVESWQDIIKFFKMMKTYHDEVGRGECPQFSSLGWVQIDHRDFVLKAHCYSTPSFGNSSKITGKRISRHSPRWGLKLSAFATETNSADVRAMVAMLPGRRALRRENWSIVGHPAVQVLLVTALSAAGIFGDGAEVNEAH